MTTESFHEQLSIDTPEHVSLRLPIAGLGSRFLALFADTVIQIVAYALLVFLLIVLLSGIHSDRVTQPMSDQATAWTVAVLIFIHFLLYWGYFGLFEGLWRGQTPGKRLFKLRVIKDSGRQVTFFEAAARNLLRVVDVMPSFYLAGILTVIFNRQRKRIGDLVAGTLVVHDEETGGTANADATRTFTAGFFEAEHAEAPAAALGPAFPADAIARLTADDLILLDTYFVRIPDLDLDTKERMAQRLLATLCAKMRVAAPATESPRLLLESVACELRNQAGVQLR